MLRITKLTDYAITLLASLAISYPQRQSAALLAQQTGIHLPTVSKLLKNLQREHIINSFLGNEGGYQLAKIADQLSLAQIITALEGPIALTECSLAQGICEQEHTCRTRPYWQTINQAVMHTLENILLSDIIKKHA